MEGLETGPLTADPLLSQALSTLPSSRLSISDHPSLPSPSDDFSDLLHPVGLNQAYNQFATLQPLAPLPPISTVTGQCERMIRQPSPPPPPPRSNTNGFYYPPTTTSFGFNTVNIKYEYDVKTDSPQHSPHEQNGVSLPADFSPHGMPDPMFSNGFNHAAYNSTLDPRSPKLEKPYFDSYVTDDAPDLDGMKKCCSPMHSSDCGDGDELDTKELATRISAELKRYSIPQAIFAQRVLCRSQGTLSDLLRNPKPWGKLKSGRETFRRMAKWLQEPEFQRMSALRLAASSLAATKRRDDTSSSCGPKKPRLVFTDIQRRTLQAIFKETKRPSREMQITISQQLNLDPTTVANFFMNARRRGHEVLFDGHDRTESESGDGASIASSTEHTNLLDDLDVKYQTAPPDPTNASATSFLHTHTSQTNGEPLNIEEIQALQEIEANVIGDDLSKQQVDVSNMLQKRLIDRCQMSSVNRTGESNLGETRVIDVLKGSSTVQYIVQKPQAHLPRSHHHSTHPQNPIFEQL
ncbi:unnamed protein product, partial [Mesorhabditis belari]|uniref:One cut domain family member n=1 Tax=Mesorhabditis belari TaxID=2138241 RepID=A0AAF3EBD5_9BILA